MKECYLTNPDHYPNSESFPRIGWKLPGAPISRQSQRAALVDVDATLVVRVVLLHERNSLQAATQDQGLSNKVA